MPARIEDPFKWRTADFSVRGRRGEAAVTQEPDPVETAAFRPVIAEAPPVMHCLRVRSCCGNSATLTKPAVVGGAESRT